MAKCNQYEYESELTPSTTGFNLVERMTPQTIPNQNTIYSNGDDLFVWDGEKYVPMVGRGCNLPLDIQLYGTWTGQLDEISFSGTNVNEANDTGISIQDAPSNMLYFIVTITCDGNYGDDVDVTTEKIWSGASLCIVLRSYLNNGVGGYTSLTYPNTVRPQTTDDLVTYPAPSSGVVLKNSGPTIIFYRTLVSYGIRKIMGGNYTVNVYGLKLGNFQ